LAGEKDEKPLDFVIFSTADWDHPSWTNKQHVAACLADMGHRILYVESLGMRAPSATARDVGRIWKRFTRLFADIRPVRENVWVLSPFSIPLQKFTLVRKTNLLLLRWKLRGLLNDLAMQNPIYWTYNPLLGELLNQKYWLKSIYHCVDEISEQPGMPAELIRQKEIELLRRIECVFVTSIRLHEEKKRYNKETYYFPNVVDFEHFHQAVTNPAIILPDDLAKIPEPRVGFIGAISAYKLDLNLIRQIASSRPEYSFVLIGDVGDGDPYTDIKELKQLKNVYFLGHRPYAKLPEYLCGFQVCLLPFNRNQYTEYMFPMKFFEYLAAGKPVVGIDLPALRNYTGQYVVATTADAFARAIDQCVFEPEFRDRLINSGIELARNNTYRKRTRAMLDIIEKLTRA
jgi:glycosyltransferase involved in cell wall biosynthesis